MNTAILLKSHCSSWGSTGSKETVLETLAVSSKKLAIVSLFEMHNSTKIRTSVNWRSTNSTEKEKQNL